MTNKKGKKSTHKKRGIWLSAWLILLAVFGVLSVLLINDFLSSGNEVLRPYLLVGLFFVAIAKIIAIVGIWNWKKWGLQLFGIAVIFSVVIGLLITGNWLISLNEVIPFAILGWLVRDKWAYFGIG